MRRLLRPAITARQALDLCIASIRDLGLTQRLRLAAATIEATETAYIAHGNHATLHLLPGSDGVAGQVSTAEMERVYASTFVRSVRTRHIYDSIKKLPENDICPLCGQRTVFTLDHYLPQTAYPALVITSANLVPACAECNKVKLAFQATDAGDQTLHPYFDDIDDERWLFARVEETSPAALVFLPVPPACWEEVKRERVMAHFKTFELGKLYASHSAVELNNMRFGLREMARRNSHQEISDHLRGIAASCAAAHPNSWQRATYEALADSVWYCSGGFN